MNNRQTPIHTKIQPNSLITIGMKKFELKYVCKIISHTTPKIKKGITIT